MRLSFPSGVAMGLAMLLAGAPAPACINTFTSKVLEARGTGNESALREITKAAEDAHRQSPTLENTNDLAVAWILTGRAADGIQLLRELDRQYPGNAIVAANLGTALELTGQDEEALQWIRESVRRDPQEHQGSEWVHVRILEAKQAIRKDPNWLRKNSVIGWREGLRFPLDERSRPRAPADIIRAIQYQLDERTQFVSPPDAVVGDLYVILGDIAHSVPGAILDAWQRDGTIASSYRSALTYGTVHEARARQRMAAAEQRMEEARPAMQAAAKREQEARALQEERQRTAQARKSDLEQAKRRRQWLAAGAFGTLALVVGGVLFYRSRRRAGSSA